MCPTDSVVLLLGKAVETPGGGALGAAIGSMLMEVGLEVLKLSPTSCLYFLCGNKT